MKAININGEIKTFSKLPTNFNLDGNFYLTVSDNDAAALGFKDVVTPAYDPRVEELTNLHLDGDVYTYDVVDKPIKETLAELKASKVDEIKRVISYKLATTDWYIIREIDSGEPTSQSIKDERAALRTKSNDLEAQINALTTKKEVVIFELPNL